MKKVILTLILFTTGIITASAKGGHGGGHGGHCCHSCHTHSGSIGHGGKRSQAISDSTGFTNRAEAKNEEVNGLKEGKWIEFLDNWGWHTKDTGNALYYTLTIYKHDEPCGMRRTYYRNGQLERAVYYMVGGLVKRGRKYNEDGTVASGNFLVIGAPKDGIGKRYFDDGRVKRKIIYAGGKRNGIAIWYYDNGIIKREANYIHGKLNGVVKEYDENGNLKSEIIYTNGKKNGNK